MRILLLAPHPFYQVRGSPIGVNLLLKVLSDRGDTVHVLTYHEGQDMDHKQVTIHRIPCLPFVSRIRPGFSWKKIVCDLLLGMYALSLQRRHRYDLVYALEESVFIALFLKLAFKAPYVYDMDSSLPQQLVESRPALAPLAPLFRRCERLAVRHASAVVPVCEALTRSILVHGPRKAVTLHDIPLIGNPSNEERAGATRVPLRAELNLAGPIIMYVGNLEPYQGIDLLLEGFRLFLGENDDTHLAIVGGEPADVELYRRRAKSHAIAHAVHFLGPRPLEDLGELLHASDLLVSPRLQGINTPMKIYSYLESGKAILATDIEAHTEVLNKNVAMLVPPTPQALARGMRELLNSTSLRASLGEAGKRLADKQFTFAAYRSTVHELFDWLERHPMSQHQPAQAWAVQLFLRSPLKQAKYRQIIDFLGDTQRLRCLDIGSDNGAISYLLRKRGGTWASADLEESIVRQIAELVQRDVFRIDGLHTPFEDATFDRVVIIDFLEHIKTDAAFIGELFRIIKPGGELIINVPHCRDTLLRRLRLALGHTDELHGHVRPGYALEDLTALLDAKFSIVQHREYSRFFSEIVDIAINSTLIRMGGTAGITRKGISVTAADLSKHRKAYCLYTFLYPLVWCITRLDALLLGSHGYMLIVRARCEKRHDST